MLGILGFVKDHYKKEDLRIVAKGFLEGLKPSQKATVVLLEGDLGAGKTTFSQAIARELGFVGGLVSPTFVIQKRYPISYSFFQNLIHIDAYRLKSSSEIDKLGWSDWIKDPTNIILVEWPSLIGDVIPGGAHKISFEHVDEDTRKIEITHG